jgi:Ca2+-binding RTX toxin-like protein
MRIFSADDFDQVSDAKQGPVGFVANSDFSGMALAVNLPSKTHAEAGQWLNRYGIKWTADADGITRITYAFRASNSSTPKEGFSRFDQAQISQTLASLQSWSDVANIQFTRVGSGTSSELAYSDNAVILFGNYNSGTSDGSAGYAYLPASNSQNSGDIWINKFDYSNSVYQYLTYGPQIITHEIGHAIGISHPGDYDANVINQPTYQNNASYIQDTRQYTIMSYFDSSESGGSDYMLAAAPLIHDIVAAQLLYGANMSTRTGDTVYGFHSTADRDWFSCSNVDGTSRKVIFAVWDAGGNDTLDFSGYSDTQLINLNQGQFSNVGGWIGNVAIAVNANIENAVGGSGSDTIYGNSLDNLLRGGAGDDNLYGGLGNDLLDGGSGTDWAYYSFAPTAVTVNLSITTAQNTGGAGIDTIANIENMLGSDFNDVLTGNGSANILVGGAGSDTLTGGGGDDTYYVDVSGDVIVEVSGGGTDYVVSSVSYTLSNNVEYLFLGGAAAINGNGNAEENFIIGNSADNRLVGGAGDDWLEGGLGNDYLDGGSGLDIASFASLTVGVEIDLSNFSGTIATSLGTDTLVSIEGLIGGAGNDVLKAGATATYLDGGAGSDFLGGSAFADTLIGRAGNDGIAAGAGNDSLYGGDGDDTLLGQAGDDTISGGIGRDFIDGGDGNDTVNAGDANDLINGGNGNDIIDGDTGNDSIFGDAGSDVIDGGAGDDELSGGNDNDTITGGAGDDRIAGGYGNDILNGGDGNDTISANDGDDTITGGAGVDNLYGFTGNDTINGGDGGDTLLGMEGTDVIRGDTGDDYIVGGDGADTLFGDDGNDEIEGNDGNDAISGGIGNDGLYGGVGNDTLNGEAGTDNLYGGDGNDILSAGDDNDVLVGGAGKDTLTGGAGADAFFFTALTDSTSAATDKITDFSWAQGDYIELSRIDANTSLAGDQAFSFVNSLSKQAGQATLTYDAASNTTTFSGDVDGDGVADFVLQVSGQQDTSNGWVL